MNPTPERREAPVMTKEKADEILACRKTCANRGVECSEDASMALAAVMFLEGHESRDAEVAALKQEIEADDFLLKGRDALLAAIPQCPAHGPCIPHAIEWINNALRLIEKQP